MSSDKEDKKMPTTRASLGKAVKLEDADKSTVCTTRQLPMFSGAEDCSLTARAWLSVAKRITRVRQSQEYCSAKGQLDDLACALTGDASIWFDEIEENISTVNQFFEEFSEEFLDPSEMSIVQGKFEVLRQGNRSVAEYSSEFQALWKKLDRSLYPEVIMARKFCLGLRANVQMTFTAAIPELTSVRKAINIALVGEAALNLQARESMNLALSTGTSTESSEKTKQHLYKECYQCGTQGHFARDCIKGPKKGANNAHIFRLLIIHLFSLVPFVFFALALATLVPAKSGNSGTSGPQWFNFATMKSGDINVHQLSLSSSGTDLFLSKNPPDLLKLTLDDSGSLVDPDIRIVSVDPVTGRCSISSTPEKTNIAGVFSFDFPRLELSSGGSTCSFLARPDGGSVTYLLYATGGKEKTPPTASSGHASSTLPSSNLSSTLDSSSMNADSSLANGTVISPSNTVSPSGESIDSSFNKTNGTNAGPLCTSNTGTSNATTGKPSSSTKNGRAEVLAGIVGLVAFMAILP